MDALSEDGQFGLTVIAFIGSVFSPYYARAGHREPDNHIALNVALYGPRRQRWAMTERGRSALRQDKSCLGIGPSRLRWDGSELVIDMSEWSVPIPRRVVGTIRLRPQAINRTGFTLDFKDRHFWHPIAPIADVEMKLTQPDISWKGTGYFDSNWGSEPIEDGFQSWDWCRAPLSDGAGIFYDAFTRDGQRKRLGLRFDKHGDITTVPCPDRIALPKGAIWRVERGVPAADSALVTPHRMLEDTPFYTRSHIHMPFEGQQVPAMHESLDLDRLTSGWVRALLPFRMPRRTG